MADEYDHLKDLWYPHTFGAIDQVLTHHFKPAEKSPSKPVALDIGCGTGIQSMRLAQLGYRVVGVDIADQLVEQARRKLMAKGYQDAEFYVLDAQKLPFPDDYADCVNCCGPTLSFIPDWRKALQEMSRCLKPGGKLLLEVEGKWTFDIFWELASSIGGNFLKYDEDFKTAISHFKPPWNVGHMLTYSFKLETGESVSMPLKLFASSELRTELASVGLHQDFRWGLHSITNLIPSTILHDADPSDRLVWWFRRLAALEARVNDRLPFNAFGCSLLVIASKNNPSVI